eukprot:XP_011674771.1 PREDICTED: protein lifeguard 4 [Strongylocentrotus purpuratus]
MSTKISMEGDSVLDDFHHSTSVMSAHIDIRMNFLRKVFGILSAQLLLTAVVSGIFMYFEGVKSYIQESPGMLMIAFVLSFIFLVALMVKSKEYPINMILLTCFLAVAFSLLVFTVQSRKDFSTWGAGLYAGLMILIVGGLLQIFIPHSDMLELVIAIGGAIVFSLFLIYDIHMIMHKLSPEEYIMASINLYLDLINLFLYILRILNSAHKK